MFSAIRSNFLFKILISKKEPFKNWLLINLIISSFEVVIVNNSKNPYSGLEFNISIEFNISRLFLLSFELITNVLLQSTLIITVIVTLLNSSILLSYLFSLLELLIKLLLIELQ